MQDRESMRFCARCDNQRWVCENPDIPWLGDRGCTCGGAGMPCPVYNQTNPEDPDNIPAMPDG